MDVSGVEVIEEGLRSDLPSKGKLFDRHVDGLEGVSLQGYVVIPQCLL